MLFYRKKHSKHRGYTTGYKIFRKVVLLRDNYRCRKCNTFSKSLHVHHIRNYNSHANERINVNNGIALCYKCHSNFHRRFGYSRNNADQLSIFLSGKRE